MGNGSICVNTKDYVDERKFTLQYPSQTKDQQNLFKNNISTNYYNNTNPSNNIIFPNYYNNSNFITMNSRKWYKAASPNETTDSTFICKQLFDSEISQRENNNNNNSINLPLGDKYE